jgi:hypothetical protein
MSGERTLTGTLRLTDAPPAPSSTNPRSTIRPASSGADQHASRRRHRTPIEEVNDVLRKLRIPELADVLQYAQRVLAARDGGPEPAVISEVLAALVQVPRAALDTALLQAEREGHVKLIAASSLSPFIERRAGIQDPKRGLLYFCAPPGSSRGF